MNAYRNRPNRIPWPPLLVLALTLLGLALSRLLPWSVAFPGSHLFGYAMIGAALAVDLWAVTALYRARTAILPHRGSSHLVTSGPFAWSRNPIYVANIVLLAGMGLAFGIGWLLVLAVIDAILTHFLAVLREENHLLAQFGYKYETYCRQVRRWV